MCLAKRQVVSIDQVGAFKVFSLSPESKLQSAFSNHFSAHRHYPVNERVHIAIEGTKFFAFEKYEDAVSIIKDGRGVWSFIHEDLIVLPVTMYNVVATGYLYLYQQQEQHTHKAFESTDILVHDSTYNRQKFYDNLLERFFPMCFAEKKALKMYIEKHGLTL